MVDRRGYGSSPDIAHSDYAVDAADIVELLGEGAHVVGHSYGGVVAMLAAGYRPQAVRSLVLIEPAALRLAADDPTVAATLQRLREAVASIPPDPSPAQYLRLSAEAMGVRMPELTPDHLRAARTALRERPSWDAQVPVEPLASATWPKLVITGSWDTASRERIGSTLVRVPGAAHEPHREQPAVVNAALRDIWDRARTEASAG